MRFLAAACSLLSVVALILTFLCLFAGSKQGFLDEFAVLTLNSSQVGQSLLDIPASGSSNPALSFFDDVTSSVQDGINDSINSLAKAVGLHDFYSIHLLNFCEGYYTPTDVPNATFPKGSISRNVTSCNDSTIKSSFNPHKTIQRELNDIEGPEIDLAELGWPSQIDDGIGALGIASRAMSVFYCINIVLITISIVATALHTFSSRHRSGCINTFISTSAALTAVIASGIADTMAGKAADIVNKHGTRIGLSADKGSKFMVFTWVATACLLLASFTWCLDCVVGRRRKMEE